MQTNRKSFGTLKSDRYIQVTGRVAAMAGFTVVHYVLMVKNK